MRPPKKYRRFVKHWLRIHALNAAPAGIKAQFHGMIYRVTLTSFKIEP